MSNHDYSGIPFVCPHLDIAINDMRQCKCRNFTMSIGHLESTRDCAKKLRAWGHRLLDENNSLKNQLRILVEGREKK